MLITTRQRRAIMTNEEIRLAYNDISLEITTGDKILGLKINEHLFWNDHF